MHNILKQRFVKAYGLMLLMAHAQLAYGKTLSEIYLSSENQKRYKDYLQEVKRQSEGTYEDLGIEKRFPKLRKSFSKSAQVALEHAHRQGHRISYMLEGKEDCNPFIWGAGHKDCRYMGVDWVAPIIHHRGDLIIKHSVELDFPLLVEGNLMIEGSLIMKKTRVPMIITGNLKAKHLLYNLQESYGPHLFVQGNTSLTGYAFLEGKTATFDPRLTSKGVYALMIFSKGSQDILFPDRKDSSPILHPFPDTPAMVRSGILEYSEYHGRNMINIKFLEQHLLNEKEVSFDDPDSDHQK
jgi:hypothetical protein